LAALGARAAAGDAGDRISWPWIIRGLRAALERFGHGECKFGGVLERKPLVGVLRFRFYALCTGTWKMAPADEYRARAKECIDVAERAADPKRKLSLLELALRWMRLAAKVDETRERKGATGGVLLDPPGTDLRTH
jgi:hypothetical protein